MIEEHFITPQPAASADSKFGQFYFDEVSAGTLTNISVAGRAGVARMSIATAAASVTNWLGLAGVQVTERSLDPICEAAILGTADTDHRIIFGFHQIAVNTTISADTNNSANECFFRKRAANNYYECVTRSASGSENIVDLTDVLTNAWHLLRIELIDATASARFYVDGVLKATVTTAVPATGTRLTMAIGHGVTSTTVRSIDIDYLSLES